MRWSYNTPRFLLGRCSCTIVAHHHIFWALLCAPILCRVWHADRATLKGTCLLSYPAPSRTKWRIHEPLARRPDVLSQSHDAMPRGARKIRHPQTTWTIVEREHASSHHLLVSNAKNHPAIGLENKRGAFFRRRWGVDCCTHMTMPPLCLS